MAEVAIVEPYVHDRDHDGWLRCRALSFLYSDYYDDVQTSKVDVSCAVQLVARLGDIIIGIIDCSVSGEIGCVETIAVHPDHVRTGIGRRLLLEAEKELRSQAVTQLDVWTRDRPATLAFYEHNGFHVVHRYLHVYPNTYVEALPDGLEAHVMAATSVNPVWFFGHADIEHEAELRSRFRRVYVCHGFSKSL